MPTTFVEVGRLFILQADMRGAVTYIFGEAGQVVWQATLPIDRIRQLL